MLGGASGLRGELPFSHMGRRVGLALVGALVVMAACSGGDDSALDEARADLNSARDDAAEARSSLEQSLAELEAMERERDEARRAQQDAAVILSDLEDERDTELRDRVAAQRELEALAAAHEEALAELETMRAEHAAIEAELAAVILRFDPEIQAAIAGAQGAAEAAACEAADRAGYESTSPPTALSVIEAATAGLPDGAVLDEAAIDAQIAECQAAGEARAAAEVLTQPKGDGRWTVGGEIAPGRWRSNGTADDCYWKRSPDGNPDDIIDNHFGNAGGTVTLREGEEFETDDCGTWEFVG